MACKLNIYNCEKKKKKKPERKRLSAQGHCELTLNLLLSCVTETISFYAYHEFVLLSIKWMEQYLESEIDFNNKWHFRKEFKLGHNWR